MCWHHLSLYLLFSRVERRAYGLYSNATWKDAISLLYGRNASKTIFYLKRADIFPVVLHLRQNVLTSWWIANIQLSKVLRKVLLQFPISIFVGRVKMTVHPISLIGFFLHRIRARSEPDQSRIRARSEPDQGQSQLLPGYWTVSGRQLSNYTTSSIQSFSFSCLWEQWSPTPTENIIFFTLIFPCLLQKRSANMIGHQTLH